MTLRTIERATNVSLQTPAVAREAPMQETSAQIDSKTLVVQWLTVGPATPDGLAMVTDDFRWQGPRSEAELFGSPDAALHGRNGLRALPAIDRAVYANYAEAVGSTNIHFMIAEDDLVVFEFDSEFVTHEGEPYHNHYCMVVRVDEGRIAEVREHSDTLYFHDVVMGTPEKRSAVLQRLRRFRAELAG
jgi:ketosteroid isomerase-like protein